VSAYLIDADYVIDALKGRADAADAITRLAPDGIAISLLTVGELYEGAFSAPDPERHLAALRGFVASFESIGLSDGVMERFARVRSDLRRRGELIPDTDILIGVTAVHHDLTLLTRNVRHLSRIPDISIYQDRAGS
jgi:tRNA(fMet)-specific endonuclease VapC